MLCRLVAATLLVAGLVAPVVDAAAATIHVRQQVEPRFSTGWFDRAYPDGNDGTPLQWGAVTNLQMYVGDDTDYNLRSLFTLTGTAAGSATLTKLSGTLPDGCTEAADGIECTDAQESMGGTLQWRACFAGQCADTPAFALVVVTPPGGSEPDDETPPTIPTRCGATSLEGKVRITCDASSDPYVGVSGSGVASYKVYLDEGATPIATVPAPASSVQPVFSAHTIGAADGTQACTQAGSSRAMSGAGAGLSNTANQLFACGHQTLGDFTVTVKLAGFTGATASTAGIMAALGTDAATVYATCRGRDNDDKVNNRYRLSTTQNASNGTASAALAWPQWLRGAWAGGYWTCEHSGDGNTFTQTEPPRAVSIGSTPWALVFHASGSAGTTTTSQLDQISITAAQPWSYEHTTATGGSYRVSAVDGAGNESGLGAAVIGTPIEAPSALVSVPAMTNTCGPADNEPCSVCTVGCNYTVDEFRTALFASGSVEVDAGDVVELRAVNEARSETWARWTCNNVSGTPEHPIWVKVREGDRIMLAGATPAGVGLYDATDCDYVLWVGSTDGSSAALQIADDSGHVPACFHANGAACYANDKAVMIRSSTGNAIVGATIRGARNYNASAVDKNSSRLLLKYVDIGRQGTNAYVNNNADGIVVDRAPDGNSANGDEYGSFGNSDSAEIWKNCASHSVTIDSKQHHSGHKQLHVCGPYQVFRRVIFDGNWDDLTAYPAFTGNHMATFQSQLNLSEWNTTTFFGPLIEDSLFYGVGSEPEHKNTNEGIQLQGYNLIFRGNYLVQRAGPGGNWGRFGPSLFSTCGAEKEMPSTWKFSQHVHVYNNTLWGGAVHNNGAFFTPATQSYCTSNPTMCNWTSSTKTNAQCQADPADCTATAQFSGWDAGVCADWRYKNNLFQGQQSGIKTGKRSADNQYEYSLLIRKPGNYTGHSNGWKSDEWFGNVFGTHPGDPAVASHYQVSLQTRGGGTGGATESLTVNADLNGDYDCADAGESGNAGWAANWCGNLDQRLTWSNGSQTAIANLLADPMPDPATLRATLALHATSPRGLGDAWPLTTTTDAGTSDTTLTLASARYFKDGWTINQYTWGGLHVERADCIAVKPAATGDWSTAAVTRIQSIDYATGAVTVSPGVTHVVGSHVTLARDNNGTCVAPWSNRGAAQ